MAKYRIPAPIIKGFQNILKLSQDQVQDIIGELNQSKFGLDSDKIVTLLEQKESLKNYSYSELKSIVKTVYSLLGIEDDSESERNQRIDDLIDSIINNSESDIDESNSEKLKGYLTLFLAIKGWTKQTIKGFQLLRENERNIINSKIITDIRVVFDDDFEDSNVENAVILHKLKIEYSHNTEIKEMFFALDSNEILELLNTLERAIKKESVLRNKDTSKALTFLSLERKTDN
tara:strand:- start:4258 stop:4953 length:696 start_codon:yes stop_codon:yes gene_type:complete